MDRRTFLKTLVVLGASFPLSIDLTAASEEEIDVTWERVRDIWGLFIVDEYGVLSYANFQEPKTRREAYGIEDASELDVYTIQDNQVFLSVVENHYACILEVHLRDAGEDLDWEEIEWMASDGWMDWVRNCSADERAELDKVLNECLDESPDWQFEWESFRGCADPQSAAYFYFLGLDEDDLSILEIDLVDGDHPGSSYMGAELKISVAEANEIAVENDWSIRFIGEKQA